MKSSCKEFNCKVYAKLDLDNIMESGYKLSDPKLITADPQYANLGLIGLVAWMQKEHTKLVTDHDWPELAVKLPESNLAGTDSNVAATYAIKVITCKGERKYYRCGSAGHICADFPDPPKEGDNRGGVTRTHKGDKQRVRKALAS
jgi:hypothetical protein